MKIVLVLVAVVVSNEANEKDIVKEVESRVVNADFDCPNYYAKIEAFKEAIPTNWPDVLYLDFEELGEQAYENALEAWYKIAEREATKALAEAKENPCDQCDLAYTED